MTEQVDAAVGLQLQPGFVSGQDKDEGFFNELCYSSVRTAVEDPVNACLELTAADHKVTKEFHLVPKEHNVEFSSAAWYGRQVGSAIGALPWYLAAEKVAGKAMGAAGVELAGADAAIVGRGAALGADATMIMTGRALALRAARSAVAGAAYEGALRPVHQQGTDFWSARALNAITGAVTFAGIGATSDLMRGLETAAVARSVSLKAPGAIVSGLASGAAGGLLGVESGSLLQQHRLADWQETKQAIVGASVLGAGMRSAHLAFERAPEVSRPSVERVSEHIEPRATPNLSSILSSAPIEDIEVHKDYGTWHKDMTFANVVREDGSKIPVLLRSLANKEERWNSVKLENGTIAYELHQRIGFDQPTPAIGQRTLSIEGGKPVNYLVEERIPGDILQDKLMQWTKERFADASQENMLKFVEQTPAFKSALEEAFVERHLYGNIDFNAANLVVQRLETAGAEPTYTVGNIDWKRSFTPRQTTSWGQEIMQFPGQQLSKLYAGKPLSPALSAKIGQFLEHFPGDTDPLAVKMGAAESAALKARGQTLLTEGFPQSYWIMDPEFSTYQTEVDDAHTYWRQKWPHLYESEEPDTAQ